MDVIVIILENVFIGSGIICLLLAILLYGKRTADWGGACLLFVKRIELSLQEHKWYRIGVSLFFIGVFVRILNLTLWG
ncbi:hypothetical protein PVK64_17010 [Aliivibrio sp. S4TY2]|uniref:hypothetical protein n=1 Tax=unclassified Aliivibrio TaxID=2645654 RepID=UPI0023780F3D|nr:MULTISPECIES: hypothetical protein [unclassified Aliivibrio]MDD9157869.1 hypothetical protein [Aliivibrio sp. S4TY2]MDD9161779.1 hypothetical protein [Aliivibrio sp. S4TY1]MDD9165809.1 hypothetical protein [Aliivibrio sp. S4MY2]MDD9169868.1 hypothetical protein [Aliivibrio sp. S4MY4]MDD9186861.1 hypothetical protein [Aliivibrio sp. S4MY3]